MASGIVYTKQIEKAYLGRDGEKRPKKNEKQICGPQSEGHEMNRTRGLLECVLGDTSDWGRWRRGPTGGEGESRWFLAGSVEPAKGKEKRWTRPINSAIVPNQGGAAVWLCSEDGGERRTGEGERRFKGVTSFFFSFISS